MGFVLDGMIVIAVVGNIKLSQIFKLSLKKIGKYRYKMYMVEPKHIHLKYDISIRWLAKKLANLVQI